MLERAYSEGALGVERARTTEEPRVVAASLSDEVTRALETLPAEFRAVLTLVIVDGLSYRETADALGCPIGTVMSRLHRARAAMLTALSANTEPPVRPVHTDASVGQARARRRTRPGKAEVFGGFVTRRAA